MALSMDLRTRLLAAVDSGSSCRAAADRFGVAPSTAVRWRAQQRETGDIAPKAARRGYALAADGRTGSGHSGHLGGAQGHHPRRTAFGACGQGHGRFRCRATSFFCSPRTLPERRAVADGLPARPTVKRSALADNFMSSMRKTALSMAA
ncbi:putative transposase [Sphingomonas sp. LH128]|nr:putative transposase [Sphingomonas sp. LH128]